MKCKALLVVVAMSMLMACAPSVTETSTPTSEENRPVATPSVLNVKQVDQYMNLAAQIVARLDPVTERVIDASTYASEQAKAPWLEDPNKTNLEAVRPLSSSPLLLDEMPKEENIKALNTQVNPFIPEPLLIAMTELVWAFEYAVFEINTIEYHLESLLYPAEVSSWRTAELEYLELTRQAYFYAGITRSQFLEFGAVPEADSERMSRAFEVQELALELAGMEFGLLPTNSGNSND